MATAVTLFKHRWLHTFAPNSINSIGHPDNNMLKDSSLDDLTIGNYSKVHFFFETNFITTEPRVFLPIFDKK